jgi:hypothetical protein
MGQIGRRLCSGPSQLLERHGRAVALLPAMVVVTLLGTTQSIDR